MSSAPDDEGPVCQLRGPEDDRHGRTVSKKDSHAQDQVCQSFRGTFVTKFPNTHETRSS